MYIRRACAREKEGSNIYVYTEALVGVIEAAAAGGSSHRDTYTYIEHAVERERALGECVSLVVVVVVVARVRERE